jgi:chain length determinant protein tyrosine kinase EpsG
MDIVYTLDPPAAVAPARNPADRHLGGILVDSGKITPAEAERALRLQESEGLRFGEACLRLGFASRADIEQALSGQFRYPYLTAGEGGLGAELVTAYSPFSPQAEALRALRAQLVLRWFTPDRTLLAVASPTPEDGRSHIAANLAIAFAQLGWETLLVDADLRRPRQHQIFNLTNRMGLSALLAGRECANGAQRIDCFSHLSVLPAGAVPPNPLELLSCAEYPQLLRQLARQYAVVLIDSPAAQSGADSQTIAVRAGGALLVVREGRTRTNALQALASGILGAGAAVVGSAINHAA